jgi:hypothetical protein
MFRDVMLTYRSRHTKLKDLIPRERKNDCDGWNLVGLLIIRYSGLSCGRTLDELARVIQDEEAGTKKN